MLVQYHAFGIWNHPNILWLDASIELQWRLHLMSVLESYNVLLHYYDQNCWMCQKTSSLPKSGPSMPYHPQEQHCRNTLNSYGPRCACVGTWELPSPEMCRWLRVPHNDGNRYGHSPRSSICGFQKGYRWWLCKCQEAALKCTSLCRCSGNCEHKNSN